MLLAVQGICIDLVEKNYTTTTGGNTFDNNYGSKPSEDNTNRPS